MPVFVLLVFRVKFCYNLIKFASQPVTLMRAFVLSSLFALNLTASRAQTSEPAILLFAGDVTLARHIEEQVGEQTHYVFDRWQEVGPYDLFMVNLENPITLSAEKVKKEFNFRMHPRYLETLQSGRIDIVNLANNHIYDYGLRGIYDTMRFLDSARIRYVGIGRTLREARRPVVMEIKGKRIGFLGYHGGGRFAAGSNLAGYVPRFKPYIVKDVAALRSKVDYIVVNFHWGTELAQGPDSSQLSLAHAVVDAGADLIVGHHPHLLQGIERYHGKTIAYSLGNFVFGGNHRDTYETAILRVVLGDGSPEVTLVPIQVTKWQPHPASKEAGARVQKLVLERSKIFSKTLPHYSEVEK